VALVAFLGIHCIVAQSDCSGKPNTNPVVPFSPVFVSKVTNGERWTVATGEDLITMLYVKGSAYDMGLAFGQMMKAELTELVPNFFKYIDAQLESYLSKLPEAVRDFIVTYGLEGALDLTIDATKPFTPARFLDEMKGMADGSGVSYQTIMRMNAFPELTKAACSMFGAWGNSTGGKGLLQLRALDWDANCPIKKFPIVTVYFPTGDASAHPHAVVGWPGLIGTIGTGYSSTGIGLSEKVWLENTVKNETRFGTPWTFVLRDVLAYATDLDSALTMLANAKRTCSIHIGVGDKNTGEFRGIEYSAKVLNIYDDLNQPTYAQHPYLEHVVYWDKHVQPTHQYCFGALLQQYYGQLTAELTMSQIAALSETGDMHIAVYDYAQSKMYVANAAFDESKGPYQAYTQPFVEFDMTSVFAHTF
jgi:hypothetical protein